LVIRLSFIQKKVSITIQDIEPVGFLILRLRLQQKVRRVLFAGLRRGTFVNGEALEQRVFR